MLVDLNGQLDQPSPSDHFGNQDFSFGIVVSQAVMPAQEAPFLMGVVSHHPAPLAHRTELTPAQRCSSRIPAGQFLRAYKSATKSGISMTSSLQRRGFLATLIAASLSLYGCSRSGDLKDIRGIDMSDTDIGRDSLLSGTDGQQHDLSDFKGKAVLLFFGFTQCPTALFRAAHVKEMPGKDGDQLQVLFITVDPERDTPEVLQAYLTAFDT